MRPTRSRRTSTGAGSRSSGWRRRRRSGRTGPLGAPTDIAIDDLLASLGLSGAESVRARGILEAERLTNPRKQRLALAKVERATAAIDARIARLCASCASRFEPDGRDLVVVPAPACPRCGGSRNEGALVDMAEACAAAGIARLVVVGGSPDVRRELKGLRPRVELRLVDGTGRRTRAEAQRDLDWADLVVVCGSSELAHRVSNLYTRDGGRTPVVTAARRGVEAIAAAVVEHARRRG